MYRNSPPGGLDTGAGHSDRGYRPSRSEKVHENLRFRFSGAICCREKIARDWGVNVLWRRRPNFIVEKKKGYVLLQQERLGPIDLPSAPWYTAGDCSTTTMLFATTPFMNDSCQSFFLYHVWDEH